MHPVLEKAATDYPPIKSHLDFTVTQTGYDTKISFTFGDTGILKSITTSGKGELKVKSHGSRPT